MNIHVNIINKSGTGRKERRVLLYAKEYKITGKNNMLDNKWGESVEKIDGREISLEELLKDKKYTIHYYQREYRWGRKQIVELINDLIDEFTSYFSDGDSREKGQDYGYYYLGSIILTKEDNDIAIIDGQQRLTSITLLLIFLNILKRKHYPLDDTNLHSMIFSSQYGIKSFNLNVEERKQCLEFLMEEKNIDINKDTPPSVLNMVERYQDIENEFPTDIIENCLLHFIDWLMKKVYFVRIETTTEQDAHKVFVTMNDRGLSLTPNEMLKGYLLSKIENNKKRNEADILWKKQVARINDIDSDSKDLDDDFIKNWIRAQYAESIRITKKGSQPEDFDLIGTEAHKWILTNSKKINLNDTKDYERFVLNEFKMFSDIYIRLREYSIDYNEEYAYVYFNANRNFTLQYQLILSAIHPGDKQETVNRKIKIVSCFIDQYITRRVINYKSCDYSTIKNAIFNLTRDFRQLETEQLKIACVNALDSMGLKLSASKNFGLNQFTRRYMLHMLARMTYYVEKNIGISQSSIVKYLDRKQTNSYDIEHIIRNSFEKEKKYFNDEEDFNLFRNRLGALVLLPKDKNRSVQDKSYSEKMVIYGGENILAKSLVPNTYVNNPKLNEFINKNGLNFTPMNIFDKQSIIDRQNLYEKLIKNIWDKGLIKNI